MTTPDPQYIDLLGQIHAAEQAGGSTDPLVEQLHTRYLELVRGGTTGNGYPYPDPTDPLAEGADAIRSLAEALTNRTVTVLPSNSVAESDPFTAYPRGISTVDLSTAAGASWPTGSSSTVMTIVAAADRAVQLAYRNTAGTNTFGYYRSGNPSGWSPWIGATGPFGEAGGSVVFPTTAAGAVSSVTVTFPAGTFNRGPNVVISGYTASPGNRHVSAASSTATSFIAYFANDRTDAGAVAAHWNATQMNSAAAPSLLVAAADAVVRCPTDGCDNENVPIAIPTSWLDDDGVEHPVDQVICGVCGTILAPLAIGPIS
jgi:hypothetical protein